MKSCKDCQAEGRDTTRQAIYPGPRCYTHHRKIAKQRKIQNHQRRVQNGYGITGEQYWTLYALQDGRCAICQRATGKTKHLAVDHDHDVCTDHDPSVGCATCVRGLLCGPCNQFIGRIGIAGLCRAIQYLQHPPARRILT